MYYIITHQATYISLSTCGSGASCTTLVSRQSMQLAKTITWQTYSAVNNTHWGTPTIDLFASTMNQKCKHTGVSEKSLSNGFIRSWPRTLTYLFPPFSLFHMVLIHLQQDKLNAILVAPWCPRQAWLLTLHQLSSKVCHLPCLLHILTQNRAQILHPDLPALHFAAWRILPP